MPKIIKVNSCGECPYIGIEKQPPLKCLCAPSDNYGTVIDDILEIPAWCPLPLNVLHLCLVVRLVWNRLQITWNHPQAPGFRDMRADCLCPAQ